VEVHQKDEEEDDGSILALHPDGLNNAAKKRGGGTNDINLDVIETRYLPVNN